MTKPVGQAEAVERLSAMLGLKLTALIARVDAVESLSVPDLVVRARLLLAYEILHPMSRCDKPAVIQAWFLGLNPDLDHRSAAALFHEEDLAPYCAQLRYAVLHFCVNG